MRFSGSSLFMQWIHPGGTQTLHGDQRSCDLAPDVTTIDQSAGSDEYMTRLVGIKDFGASIAILMQDNDVALENSLVEGTLGTLIVGPAGTVAGKRKYTLPLISKGPNVSIPYTDVVEFTNDFEGNLTADPRGVYP